jgi:DNA polymerase
MISPEQRSQYLDAMGVQVWLERSALPEEPSLDNAQLDVALLDLEGLKSAVESCQHCDLSQTRQQVAFGAGSQQAPWLLIGDMPSEFEGASGSLLNDMLLAIGETRQSTYLTTSVKCRSDNKTVTEKNLQSCSAYLLRQIELVQPSVVLVMGEQATQSLLSSSLPLSALRGKEHCLERLDATVIATHHPRELLTTPALKREAWQDLQLAKKQLQQ